MVGVGRWQHAVTEVEHVAGPPVVLGEDPPGGLLDTFPRPQEQHRVQVALYGPVADLAAPLGQRDPPVEADHVTARGCLELQNAGRADAEVDRWHAQLANPLEQAPHRRPQPQLVIQRAQAADPGVEHLDGLGARLDLCPQIADGRVHEDVQEARPCLGLPVHQPLGLDEVAGRPTLHEVAGERERRPGEADQGNRRLGTDQPDRLEQRCDGGLRLEGAERGHVVGRANRPLDDRADALANVEIHAQSGERRGDIREQDRRVHAQAADRLERDLGAQGRVPRDLQQRGSLPDPAVLGQRTPGLAHEPDRRGIDGRATDRAQEPGVGARRRYQGRGGSRGHVQVLDAHAANAFRAAASVAPISVSPWAIERNQASNCEGASSTPSSSIAPKKRA